MPEVDPTRRVGEGVEQPVVPVVAPAHPANPGGPSFPTANEVPKVAPTRRSRIPRLWLPWISAIVVALVGLAIALGLTLGGSSSSTTPTPTAPANGSVAGSYLTTTVQDSRLVFATLVQSGSTLGGTLIVTTSGPTHKHLVARHYNLTGTISGSTLHLTLKGVTGRAQSTPFTATYESGKITAGFGTATTITLQRGTFASYRLLVKQDRTTLLG